MKIDLHVMEQEMKIQKKKLKKGRKMTYITENLSKSIHFCKNMIQMIRT